MRYSNEKCYRRSRPCQFSWHHYKIPTTTSKKVTDDTPRNIRGNQILYEHKSH